MSDLRAASSPFDFRPCFAHAHGEVGRNGMGIDSPRKENTMLRKMLIALFALAASLPALAAKDQETIELKDGTTLIIQTDGKMRHVDQRGHAVLMKEGEVMEAKDGSHLMMKNSAIWKQLYEKGTLNPKQ
jgi:Copper resistance protein K